MAAYPGVVEASSITDAQKPSSEDIVLLKEESVKRALAVLQSMYESLQQAQPRNANFDSQAWMSSRDEIVNDHQSFEFFTGVAGDTGMGKTSLLNVLLNRDETIAPSSQNGACTAAVCCFKYHAPTDGHKLKATVRLKSKAAVDAEMEAFFNDKAELEAQHHRDDSFLHEEEQSIREQLSLIASWSGLSTEQVDKLGSVDPKAITSSCTRSVQFFHHWQPDESVEITFSKSSAHDFLQELKKYISSAGTNSKTRPAWWPIVELVNIFLPSDLLRQCPGLVLVDLPGETDASEARSKVAQRYYSKLHQLMILTPSDRARDNRTAASFIRDDHLCDIDADGKMQQGSNFLAIIISKIDSLGWKRFVQDEEDPTTISEELPTWMEDLKSLEKKKKKLKTELRDQWERIQIAEQDSDAFEKCSGSLKRVQGAGLVVDELKKETNRQMNEFRNMEDEIKTLNAQCFKACIDFRSRDTIENFQLYIDEVRNRFRRREKVKTDITVLPISSQAQRCLDEEEPMPGFPDSKATGFDDLKRWIIVSSLPKREEHADNILHRCLILFDAIEGWAKDDHQLAVAKLPPTELVRIQSILKTAKKEFEKGLLRLGARTRRRLAKEAPFLTKNTRNHEELNISTRNLKETIRGFQESQEAGRPRLHWATYHACIRRRGGPFKSRTTPQRTHHWQSRMYTSFWLPILESWSKTFTQTLPKYELNVTSTMQSLLEAFEQKLSQCDELPVEYKVAFKHNAYRLEHFRRHFRTEVRSMIQSCRESANHVRQQTREKMTRALQPAYVDALKEHGPGRTGRQIRIFETFADKETPHIVQVHLWDAICDEMKGVKESTLKRMSKITDDLLKRASKNSEEVALDVCSTGSRRVKADPADDALRTKLLTDFKLWEAYWQWLKPQVPEVSLDTPGGNIADEDDEDGDEGESVITKAEASGTSKKLATKTQVRQSTAKTEKKTKAAAGELTASKPAAHADQKKARKGAVKQPKPVSTTGDMAGVTGTMGLLPNYKPGS